MYLSKRGSVFRAILAEPSSNSWGSSLGEIRKQKIQIFCVVAASVPIPSTCKGINVALAEVFGFEDLGVAPQDNPSALQAYGWSIRHQICEFERFLAWLGLLF